MATRKKSRQDIVRQLSRIGALNDYLSSRDGSNAARNAFDAQDYVDSYRRGAERSNNRYDKAVDIATRYVGNIAKTKSYQNAKNKAQANPSLRDSLRAKATNRKYSQRTYMGGNAG